MLYASRMNTAYSAYKTSDCRQARRILEAHVPRPGEEDLRGFEWYYLHRLCHEERHVLRHGGPVTSVTFSPDATALATGSHDGTFRLFEPRSGRELARFEPQRGHVTAPGFSPSGRVLAVATGDFAVALWDLETRERLAVLEGHRGTVTAAAFSPDGRLLATASGDHTARIWSVAEHREVAALRGHTDAVCSLAFSPGGRLLATVSSDYDLRLWEMPPGEMPPGREPTPPLRAHAAPVLAVAFSPDGKSLASGSWDRTVTLWDASSWREAAVFRGHQAPVVALAFSPASPLLATGSGDHTVRLVEATSCRELRVFKGHERSVNGVAFSPGGTLLASGSDDGTARVWDVAAPVTPCRIEVPAKVQLLASGTSRGTLVTGSCELLCTRWRLGSDPAGPEVTEAGAVEVPLAGRRTTESLAPNGTRAAAAGPGPEIYIWRLRWEESPPACEEEACLRGHSAPVLDLAFSQDSRTLVSTSRDGTVRLWRREQGAAPWVEAVVLEAGAGDVNDAELSPDGRTLAMARRESPVVLLWDAGSQRQRGVLRGHTRWVCALAFSSDSRLLATGGLDWSVKVWELGEAGVRERFTLEGHGNAVASLAFSPDGKILASGSDDRLLKLWDLVSGEERATLEGHRGHVETIAFSLDGRTLVTAGGILHEFGELLVWRTDSQASSRTLEPLGHRR